MVRRNEGISRRGALIAAGAAIGIGVLGQPPRAGTIRRPPAADALTSGQRAELAERAIVSRHVRALWGLPQRSLGALVWPASPVEQSFGRWCYWWQAHLVDCAVDAAHRDPTPARTDRVAALALGIRTRNITGWTNRYYDDMAWLALALERADRLLGIRFGDAIGDLRSDLLDGWNAQVGAVPWRSGDPYFNTPAVGPTGIALARLGDLGRARQLAEFLHTRLRDPATGLTLDGVHEPDGQVNRTIHTYCQGVAIGLETELAVRTGDAVHRDRAAALVAATATALTNGGVIIAATANDSGLFMGILARYLAETALALGDATAAAIVRASARAAWEHRAEVDGLPLFGMDWTRPIAAPEYPSSLLHLAGADAASAANLSRDLSVQLSGWMLLEADHQLTAAGR
ncbi:MULTISPECIES: glycoside hydrolase family 76 protein [unclassified Nocardia]|uniref:glycoside hydrolase family 76 protein n=1 Tax=unclassified Nocardia TaxID=2637762 RepID=UPI0033BE2C02